MTALSGVLQRLAALELALAGIGHNNPPDPIDDDKPDNEPSEFDPATDRRLPTKATAERYGVSTRTIERWRDDPKLNFPRPDKCERPQLLLVVEARAPWPQLVGDPSGLAAAGAGPLGTGPSAPGRPHHRLAPDHISGD